MSNFLKIYVLLFAMTTLADNEIYIDQSGACLLYTSDAADE